MLIMAVTVRYDRAVKSASRSEADKHLDVIQKYLEAIADTEEKLRHIKPGRPIKPGSRGRGTGLVGQYMKRAPKPNGRPKQLPRKFDAAVFQLVDQEMQSMKTLRPGEKVTVKSTLKRLMLDKVPKEYGLSEEEVLGFFGRYLAAYNRGKKRRDQAKKAEASNVLSAVNLGA